MLKDGYNKMVPPVQMAPDRTMIPVTVAVSIVLLKIVEIEEENHAIEFQYEIIMKWRDNRVAYHNLKRDTSLNALPEVDFKRLWLPLVIYENTDQKVTTRLGMEWEWSTSVTVTKEGNFTRSGLDSLHEIETFKGGENTLTMRQTYTNKFQCNFILNRYPFDTQVTGLKNVLRFQPSCDSGVHHRDGCWNTRSEDCDSSVRPAVAETSKRHDAVPNHPSGTVLQKFQQS